MENSEEEEGIENAIHKIKDITERSVPKNDTLTGEEDEIIIEEIKEAKKKICEIIRKEEEEKENVPEVKPEEEISSVVISQPTKNLFQRIKEISPMNSFSYKNFPF